MEGREVGDNDHVEKGKPEKKNLFREVGDNDHVEKGKPERKKNLFQNHS